MDNIYQNNFYGDSFRWFIGTVESVNDPMKLGRVRVRVHGLHTSELNKIQISDLPWAQTVNPTTEGGISGIGRTSRLLPGASVYGIFLDGKHSQLPLIIGSMSKFESPGSTYRALYSPDTETNNKSTGEGYGSTGVRNTPIPENTESIGIVGNTNAERAFNFFTTYGFTKQQAAGIVGNLMQESGPALSTTVKSAGSEQSFGIAQWNKGVNRYQELVEFANNLGKPWSDLDVQLQFIIWELENRPYLGLSQLRSAKTIEQATIVFQNKYERPSTPHTNSRIRYAKEIYNRMSS